MSASVSVSVSVNVNVNVCCTIVVKSMMLCCDNPNLTVLHARFAAVCMHCEKVINPGGGRVKRGPKRVMKKKKEEKSRQNDGKPAMAFQVRDLEFWLMMMDIPCATNYYVIDG